MAENKDKVSEEVTADVTETEEEGSTVSAEFSIEGIYIMINQINITLCIY